MLARRGRTGIAAVDGSQDGSHDEALQPLKKGRSGPRRREVLGEGGMTKWGRMKQRAERMGGRRVDPELRERMEKAWLALQKRSTPRRSTSPARKSAGSKG